MRNSRRREEEDSGFIEKTIHINRVSKVVKGGRRFNFTAIVVSGDGQGKVGVGYGKANEVPEAIRKGTEKARRGQVEVPIVDGTVPHFVIGEFGAARVIIRPASPGTGVIASSAVRSILDAAGYHNVLTKVVGTNNPHNVVRAVFNALEQLESPEQYAVRTGRSLDEVMGNYNVGAHVWKTGA
ncbi:MAG: 30S ribosomal protein S5 [Deltaproteobacteria bacterium]|nr:MAG: 30S ribosomal protein S5 [Deltaproteobacteria bacterium]